MEQLLFWKAWCDISYNRNLTPDSRFHFTFHLCRFSPVLFERSLHVTLYSILYIFMIYIYDITMHINLYVYIV